ncbi:MAG: hypothetical protein K8T90_15045 [Planctomycetes bacterium]|nr:hypothetical protein [Planctomycetota bacterium]
MTVDDEGVTRAIRRRWFERLLASRPPLTDEDVLGAAIRFEFYEWKRRRDTSRASADQGLRGLLPLIVPRFRRSLRRAGWVRSAESEVDDALRGYLKWARMLSATARELNRIARTMRGVSMRSAAFRRAWGDFAAERPGLIWLMDREQALLCGDERRRIVARAVERRRNWPSESAVLPGDRDRFVPIEVEGGIIRVPRPGRR